MYLHIFLIIVSGLDDNLMTLHACLSGWQQMRNCRQDTLRCWGANRWSSPVWASSSPHKTFHGWPMLAGVCHAMFSVLWLCAISMLTLCPSTCHDFTIQTSVLNVSDYDILVWHEFFCMWYSSERNEVSALFTFWDIARSVWQFIHWGATSFGCISRHSKTAKQNCFSAL